MKTTRKFISVVTYDFMFKNVNIKKENIKKCGKTFCKKIFEVFIMKFLMGQRQYAWPIICFSILSQCKSITIVSTTIPKMSSFVTMATKGVSSQSSTRSKNWGRSWGIPRMIVFSPSLSHAFDIVLGHIFRDGGLTGYFHLVTIPHLQAVRGFTPMGLTVFVIREIKYSTTNLEICTAPIEPNFWGKHVSVSIHECKN